MSDFERFVGDSLKSVGYDYYPADIESARAEFLRRRRFRLVRFAAGGAVLAGATALALFALVAAPVNLQDSQPVVGAGKPTLGATIAVGERPGGIAAGAGFIWVANEGDGTVSKIDPTSEQVIDTIELGGVPDDVVVYRGAVWVSDSEAGSVTPVDPASGEAGSPMLIGSGGHVDLAVGQGFVWAVARDGYLYKIDPVARTPEVAFGYPAGGPSDVATGGGYVYTIDFPRGAVDGYAPTEGFPIGERTFEQARSAEGDLVSSHAAVWIASPDPGLLLRVDAGLSDTTAEVPFEADYAALAVGQEALWLLTGDSASERGALARLDLSTGGLLGPVLPLTGKPFDIAVGNGAIWVSNSSAGTVTKYTFDEQPQAAFAAPSPSPLPAIGPPTPQPVLPSPTLSVTATPQASPTSLLPRITVSPGD